MMTVSWFRSSLLLLGAVLIAVSAISSTVHQFDISEYIHGLDHDLQAMARSAIEAERFAYQLSQNKIQQTNTTNCKLQPEGFCRPSTYRTSSGNCNNVRHPAWGARSSPFLKLLPAAYADGISKPRQSVGSHILPVSTDIISNILLHLDSFTTKESHEGLTSLSGIWSELVLQDIASIVHPVNLPDQCCSDKRKHSECYEIRDANFKCKSYWRSVPSSTGRECYFEGRKQMNGASSYLDGSGFYGANDDKLDLLRTYTGGQVNLTACEYCNLTEPNALGLLYQVFLREHNRIAEKLSAKNVHWDDKKLFLEARHIVIAQLQHVTFNEYVPAILGESTFVDPDLRTVTSGYYTGYSSSNKAGTYDAVALTALQALTWMSANTICEATTCIQDHMILSANPLSLSNAPNAAIHFVHVARDHGVVGYVKFLTDCLGDDLKITDFTDLAQVMQPEYAELLSSIYLNLEDVDLLVGGILETPIKGAAIGPTFECLLKKQFVTMRQSDRFWYENDIPPSGLTSEQLIEIRKVSLAGILCANTDIHKIQPNVFIQRDSYLNSQINCKQYKPLEITAWIEEPLLVPEMQNSFVSTATSTEFIPEITPEVITAAIKKAEEEIIERKQLEYNAWLEQRIADPKSPTGTAASFSKANKDALLLANSSIMYELTTNELLNSVHSLRRRKRQIFDNTDVLNFPNEFSDLLQNIDISGFASHQKATHHDEIECPADNSPCDPTTPYRTFSGHCNNLRSPSVGKSLTTFARLIGPIYDDGVSKPRSTSVTGIPLPNPRVISTVIHPDISNLHNRYTLMVMQFAQFLDHDLTMTPIHKGFAESIPSCRACDSPRTVHPECNPFPVPLHDHHYPTKNLTTDTPMCFPSMRSLPGQQHLGHREQINQNTAFLDASVIYGENECICKVLRGFSGRMNVTAHPNNGKDLLPQSSTHPECKSRSGFCFIGGDGRASEQPALAVMHTLWVREHNRMIEGLRQVNPHWEGEKLFQQARRIISAMLQHITYNEFLPRILGWNAVDLYGLKLFNEGYYKAYSPTCNPSVLNEFATAAFRIGHSLLRPHLPRMDRNYQNIDPPILLRDGFFNPDMLYQDGMIDEMLRGLASTPMETLDQFITGEVTNHLFETKNIPFSGVDLIALNIHRARDHGLPSYNDYRALCNLKRATTFEDLSREMASEVIERLKRIYVSVDDIDLFPGGMSERPLQGGLVGPTFACIIAIQFRQLRKCDRFWYETDDPNIRFTEHQMAEIRKTTLAKVLCENMDQHVDMQRAVFDLPNNYLNPRVPCSSMPHMDFSAWRETRHCQIGGRTVALGEAAFPTPCTSCICRPDGARCASLRVMDCHRLLQEVSREAILQDDICTAQCGFVLATTETKSRLQRVSSSSSFSGFVSNINNFRH